MLQEQMTKFMSGDSLEVWCLKGGVDPNRSSRGINTHLALALTERIRFMSLLALNELDRLAEGSSSLDEYLSKFARCGAPKQFLHGTPP